MSLQFAYSWAQKLKTRPHGTGEMLSLAIVPCLPVQLARKIKSITAAKKRYSQVTTQESLKMMTRGFFCLFL